MGSGDSLEETWGAQFAAEHPEAPHPALVDQTGRVLGKRAQGTRQRLLDSTEQLLEAQSLRDLRVIDIARNVGASPATFYQYFKDVEEAVLALAEQASQEMPAVA
ncbi:MAG: TetR/AcrR family transcriptional regulator, partial [Deltaproteobacteria bacterium]|nr:TetR/AcrR family transcriptional regulator [Deltaproteobacteria bacterium]